MCPSETFSVDTSLLDELGERLVGRPSVALAELIKNGYDADATKVEILVDPEGNRIDVRDNGHGMTEQEFRKLWMRVGTRHKRERETSREFHRPLTGSKGVGRIAARVLSHALYIETIGKGQDKKRLAADLDWRKAQAQSDELTKVRVQFQLDDVPVNHATGTLVELRGLRHEWDASAIEDLAKEIWHLQPPLPPKHGMASTEGFAIEFNSPIPELREKFDEKLTAILDIWFAKIEGVVKSGKNKVKVTFREPIKGEKTTHVFDCPDPALEGLEYEVRAYRPEGRQPHGLKVNDVRDYLKEFGGVRIYDAGFRVPLYGAQGQGSDWLHLDFDQARSLTSSQLLPADLQQRRGMLHMPRNMHLLGAVHINTRVHDGLNVTISRDRLEATPAFDALRDSVRISIDYYTQLYAARRLRKVEQEAQRGDVVRTAKSVSKVLDEHKTEIPKMLYKELKTAVQQTVGTTRKFEARAETQAAVLGTLATAGISALAFQHEFLKHMKALQRIVKRLHKFEDDPKSAAKEIHEVSEQLEGWAERTESMHRLLSHLREGENVREVEAFSVRAVVREAWRTVEPIAHGIQFDSSNVDPDLDLPKATFAEWISVFQNLFFNAVNAMLDSDQKRLTVRAKDSGGRSRIAVLDTGCGVDIAEADKLFEPFERRLKTSRARRRLGLGGTGLGLTIVRMICTGRGVKVHFSEPPQGYSTSIELTW